MILKYKFEYQSNNNSFISILDNLLKTKDCDYIIDRIDDKIYVYIEDEEEKLLKLSDQLSTQLPISIFLKDFSLEVVPLMPPTNYQITLDSCKKSYCSNCLNEIGNKESTNYYNPFITCPICGTTSNEKSIDIYENKKPLDFENFEKTFIYLANSLKDKKVVKVTNSSGTFYLKILEKIEKEDQWLLCNTVEKLSNITVGSKEKNIALLSLEKPIVEYNVNTIYQRANNIDIERVNISYPWDLVLYLLSKELLKQDIEFLSIEKDIDNYDLELCYDKSFNQPKVRLTKNKIFLLENSCYDKRLEDIYKKYNEESKSQFAVLLDENRLYEKSILNIYLSSKYSDGICLYSPKIDGMVDIVKFDLPNSIGELFEEIKKEKKGEKLLKNYKDKFPEIYEDAIKTDISNINKRSITSLWKIVSIVLQMDDIFSNASTCLLQKGPRIDYKLEKSDKLFNKEFNFIKFIKSGISFKLAGVDEKTISLGYVESFLYFLSDLYDKVNEQFELDGISLCGDLIASDLINKHIGHIFNKELNIYYNKDFPIQK